MGDNIKVIDAEPQQQATASPSQQGGINANALLNNTLDGFANLSSKFNPFAQRLGKGIGQVRQVRYQPGRDARPCWLMYASNSMHKSVWVQPKTLQNFLKSIRILKR